jgi:uncharacterized protein
MSGQPVIEPAKFARGHGKLTGRLDVSALTRVADLLFDTAGSLEYAVSGYVNERGHSALQVCLDGELNLRCQRCLGPLPQPVHTQRDIVLVPGADEFAQRVDEAEAEDVIPDVPRLELAPLLEEELLLGLPLAARHEDGACSTGVALQPAQSGSPFAALAKLKQQ